MCSAAQHQDGIPEQSVPGRFGLLIFVIFLDFLEIRIDDTVICGLGTQGYTVALDAIADRYQSA